MIPQRTPTGVNAENAVRSRVAACRQRLRNSRTTHKTTKHSQISEGLAELSPHPAEMIGVSIEGLNTTMAAKAVAAPMAIGCHKALVMRETKKREGVGIT